MAAFSLLSSDNPTDTIPNITADGETKDRTAVIADFFLFASVYIHLSVAWVISYSVYFRFPQQCKLVVLGILVCSPLLALAFYVPVSESSLSPRDVNIWITGTIGLVFTTVQFLMSVYFFELCKRQYRRVMSEYRANRYPRLKSMFQSLKSREGKGTSGG